MALDYLVIKLDTPEKIKQAEQMKPLDNGMYSYHDFIVISFTSSKSWWRDRSFFSATTGGDRVLITSFDQIEEVKILHSLGIHPTEIQRILDEQQTTS